MVRIAINNSCRSRVVSNQPGSFLNITEKHIVYMYVKIYLNYLTTVVIHSVNRKHLIMNNYIYMGHAEVLVGGKILNCKPGI